MSKVSAVSLTLTRSSLLDHHLSDLLMKFKVRDLFVTRSRKSLSIPLLERGIAQHIRIQNREVHCA